MPLRPLDLSLLKRELKTLAVHGGIGLDTPHRDWYASTGIALEPPDPSHLVVNPVWAKTVLPADGDADLLRRCLMWDPQYRLHLDLCLVEILNAVASGGRWERFEKVLRGPFRTFAPRFVSLVEWAGRKIQKPAWKLKTADWRELDSLANETPGLTAEWDAHFWGGGGSADRFPLYETIYMPLHPLPISVNFQELNPDHSRLLGNLIAAAAKGEGVPADPSVLPLLDEACQQGIPIRIQEEPHPMAVLAGRVIGIGDPGQANKARLPETPLPESAAKSRVLRFRGDAVASDLWQHMERSDGAALHPVIGVPSSSTAWPKSQSPDLPPWGTLPPATALESIRPKPSPETDDAILSLAKHGVMGFFIQLLLLEALDRELGQETLLIAFPANRQVEPLEPATQILYRPRRKKAEGGDDGSALQMVELGLLDSVLTRVARAAGIDPLPLDGHSDFGVWSLALALLRHGNLIQDLHDRLIMHPRLLDRLHGGGLMRAVIRRGQPFRDRLLHPALKEAWRDQMGNRETPF